MPVCYRFHVRVHLRKDTMQAKEQRQGLQALLTPDEAATALGCGRTYVYELMGKGELRSVKLGRLRRIPHAEIARLVDSLMGAQFHQSEISPPTD